MFETPAWKALATHAKSLPSLKSLAADPNRFEPFSIKIDGMLFDYSKQRLDTTTRKLLIDALKASNFANWRDRMFLGDKINTTEKRPVLHTALRTTKDKSILVEGRDVVPDVREVLDRLEAFCKNTHTQKLTGYTGKPITNIVHIGIGGSHLGPQMVVEALTDHHIDGMSCHFVSNIDGHNMATVLKQSDPETTLFLIASKTFTTQETMMNAKTARNWFVDTAGDNKAVAKHFVALSTNIKAATDFGIAEGNIFGFWDWVGGRYSLWSAIGMPIALMVGMEHFRAMLKGACAMDQHFFDAPAEQNIPVMMALIGLWNRSFLDMPSHVMAVYDHRLSMLPDWLKQTDMESNGKSIDRHGLPVDYTTGPLVMGGAGTDIQHSFFQWMHQGTGRVPTDFIICKKPAHEHSEHHRTLMSHFLAQQRALMLGVKNADAPHRAFDGGRPSSAIILDELTPHTLGMLLAAFEHKIFVQGVLWNINSFDQFGVELGKTMANEILENWDNLDAVNLDSSTAGLLKHLQG